MRCGDHIDRTGKVITDWNCGAGLVVEYSDGKGGATYHCKKHIPATLLRALKVADSQRELLKRYPKRRKKQ